jgi:hypothetical protein
LSLEVRGDAILGPKEDKRGAGSLS